MTGSLSRRSMLGLALAAPVALPIAISTAAVRPVHHGAAAAFIAGRSRVTEVTVLCDSDLNAKISRDGGRVIIDVVKRAMRRGELDAQYGLRPRRVT